MFRLLKSTHTHLYFKYMTWTLKQPLCPKTTLYLNHWLGWGRGDPACDKSTVYLTWSGDSPHPLPPKAAHLSDKGYTVVLNWPLRKEGWKERGGGEGWILGQIPPNMLCLEKQGYFIVRRHSQSKSFHGRPNS
jgi:hypothetical protein